MGETADVIGSWVELSTFMKSVSIFLSLPEFKPLPHHRMFTHCLSRNFLLLPLSTQSHLQKPRGSFLGRASDLNYSVLWPVVPPFTFHTNFSKGVL